MKRIAALGFATLLTSSLRAQESNYGNLTDIHRSDIMVSGVDLMMGLGFLGLCVVVPTLLLGLFRGVRGYAELHGQYPQPTGAPEPRRGWMSRRDLEVEALALKFCHRRS